MKKAIATACLAATMTFTPVELAAKTHYKHTYTTSSATKHTRAIKHKRKMDSIKRIGGGTAGGALVGGLIGGGKGAAIGAAAGAGGGYAYDRHKKHQGR
jgi:uncharacterized protein YcfJ